MSAFMQTAYIVRATALRPTFYVSVARIATQLARFKASLGGEALSVETTKG